MALPTEQALTQTIKKFVDAQKKLPSDKDPETAFAKGLAKIILDTISSAQVTLPSGSVVVSGPSGGSTNPQPITGTLQ